MKERIQLAKYDDPFFTMPRTTAQDKSLSWAARGVLAYLLSKPMDWVVQVADLQQGCGRDKVYAVLNELIAARYVLREIVQDKEGKLKGYDYRVYRTPFPEKPYTVKPYTANPDSTEYREEQNIESVDEPLNPSDEVAGPTVSANASPLEASEVALEKPKRKSPTRDALYTAVANTLMNLHTNEVIEQNASYVNTLRRIILDLEGLSGKPTSVQSDVLARGIRIDFVTWYRQVCPGCNLPSGKDSLRKYYGQFIEKRQKQSPIVQPVLFLENDDYVAPGKAR